jgi:DNA-binding MarR family transcriptional regulator
MIRFLTAAAAATLLAGAAGADIADDIAAECISEGENAEDCRCVADQMEAHLTAQEMQFMLRIAQAETRDQQTMMTIAGETGMTVESLAAMTQKMVDAEPTVREICGSSLFE